MVRYVGCVVGSSEILEIESRITVHSVAESERWRETSRDHTWRPPIACRSETVVAKLFKDHPDATLGDFRDVLTSALAMSSSRRRALRCGCDSVSNKTKFSRRQKDAFFCQ